MPLDGGAEGALGPLERLDEVVGRRRERDEAGREVLHRLVVLRVDGSRSGDRPGKRGAGGRGGWNANGVHGGVVLVLLAAVNDAPAPLRRQVLPEGPAEGDVQDLQAAADAEDGDLTMRGAFQEAEVERVALGTDLDARSRRRVSP